MGIFFAYILKSSVCLAAFYLFFRWLMARETFHRFNRFALLGILVLSCLLPLVQVSVEQPATEVRQTMLTIEQMLMMADVEAGAEVGSPQTATVTWAQAVLLIYLAGIVILAVWHVCSMLRLWRLISSGTDYTDETQMNFTRESLCNPCLNKFRLIIHDRNLAPFSWMKYIVISRSDLEENGKEILMHESAHIRNRHSWDLLVADLCILFQWFNPAAWLLKQELQAIHEYEADATVLSEGVNAKEYQLLLIRKAVGTRLYSMANSLNHSKLKKRITMMQKEKSNPWARVKYLYVLPVAAVAVAAFARPEVSDKVSQISSVKVNDLAEIAETIAPKSLENDTIVYEVVEEMPEFPGGQAAFMQYLQDNVRYPQKAKERGTQGRVTVQFIVRSDGSITDVQPLRSIDEELDAEAIRLIKDSPKWKPGKQKGVPVAVRYTAPVKFALDEPATAGKTIFEVVEVMPEYPDGGLAGFMAFLTKNMKYPEGAKLQGIQGRVTVQFVVDTDGVVKDPRIFRSANHLLDSEALRLVNLSPKWKPGTQRGTPVAVKYTVPILFKLDGDVKNTTEAKIPTVYYMDGELVELNGKGIEDVVPAEKIIAFEVIREEGMKKVYLKTEQKEGKATPSNGTKMVSGTVTDEQGDPIVGALIKMEGSTLGTVTDVDGKFTLKVPTKDVVLVVSYIDKETERIAIKGSEMTVAVKLKAE